MNHFLQTPRLIVALDFTEAKRAEDFVTQLQPSACCLKIGYSLFMQLGAAFVERLVQQGFKVFLDLKLHDIPQTVERACRVASELGVWMLTVHTLGGADMLEAAKQGVHGKKTPLIVGVTVLTSLAEQDLAEIGLSIALSDQVQRLALLAQCCGLDGVVCSGQEAQQLREQCGEGFCLVTPGIRLTEDNTDQKRVMTPEEAIRAGADYLVVGRPIIQAADPMEVIRTINLKLQ